jgi:hypothetical protein
MIRIHRNALVQSSIAGGASKGSAIANTVDCPGAGTDTSKSTTQMSGTTSSLIVINGKTVVNETHTFTA